MTLSLPTARAVDLRKEPVSHVLDRVEQALGVHLDRETMVRKRRSVGARTDRNSWVRIERRGLDRIGKQGWDGAACAEALQEVAKPTWYGCVSWREASEGVMWRADETALLPGAPVGTSIVAVYPDVSDEWWAALNASLDALATQQSNRIATPDTETITQSLVNETIWSVFPRSLDTTVEEWRLAHADLNWANVTAPQFCLFDWEDWGMAPRGLDAATLWGASLAVPALAKRVRHERREDFASRAGMVMTLFVAAKILGPHAHPEDPRLEPARVVSAQVVKELQTG
jgi:hypothetical protein